MASITMGEYSWKYFDKYKQAPYNTGSLQERISLLFQNENKGNKLTDFVEDKWMVKSESSSFLIDPAGYEIDAYELFGMSRAGDRNAPPSEQTTAASTTADSSKDSKSKK